MFTFDFAISYASEEIGLAEDISKLLTEQGAKVFFAKHYESYLLGKKLREELKKRFGPEVKFVVPIISKYYIAKPWPKYEFKIAKAEGKGRQYEFILPVRLDDNKMPQLSDSVAYLDIRRIGIFSTVDKLISKLREHFEDLEKTAPKVWVATFGVNVDDLLISNQLPTSAPSDYVYLCDWLEDDLRKRLSKSSIKDFTFSEPSGRDGETLSVRIAFRWDPEKIPLDFGELEWWEVLEIDEFERIYPDENGDKFLSER